MGRPPDTEPESAMPEQSFLTPDNAQSLRTYAELLPAAEALSRAERCRTLLRKRHAGAGGLLVTGRANLLWLTGSLCAGLLWLPLSGEPLLFLRKGLERARAESPLRLVFPFVSYRELPALAAEAGSPLADRLAVDKSALSWAQAERLMKRLPGIVLENGDDVLVRARSVKSPWEQKQLRACGRIHAAVMDEILPALLRPGLTEAEIALLYVSESLRAGSDGLHRVAGPGEEMFYGYAACGDHGNCPTSFNGPLGCLGLHPATPFLGSRDRVWRKDEILSLDMGCQKAGYNTDRTQVYWPGRERDLPAPVLAAQEACAEIFNAALEALRPGVTPAEIWALARRLAGKLGVSDRFMGLGRDRVPFLGHGTGLVLDEWPPFARAFHEPLEAGMSLALEPKIAVPGHGMPGIEHTVLLTRTGPELLTGSRTGIFCLED